MLIACTNKGCMQTTNALLNTETLEVICADCGQSISNVSESMRRTLKSFGQIIRTDQKKAFMMACRTCNANREVVLNDKNETVCGICGDVINVHPAMKQAIAEIGTRIVAQTEKKQATEAAKKVTKKTSKKKVSRKTEE